MGGFIDDTNGRSSLSERECGVMLAKLLAKPPYDTWVVVLQNPATYRTPGATADCAVYQGGNTVNLGRGHLPNIKISCNQWGAVEIYTPTSGTPQNIADKTETKLKEQAGKKAIVVDWGNFKIGERDRLAVKIIHQVMNIPCIVIFKWRSDKRIYLRNVACPFGMGMVENQFTRY